MFLGWRLETKFQTSVDEFVSLLLIVLLRLSGSYTRVAAELDDTAVAVVGIIKEIALNEWTEIRRIVAGSLAWHPERSSFRRQWSD